MTIPVPGTTGSPLIARQNGIWHCTICKTDVADPMAHAKMHDSFDFNAGTIAGDIVRGYEEDGGSRGAIRAAQKYADEIERLRGIKVKTRVFLAIRVWDLGSDRPSFATDIFYSVGGARDFMREQGYREGDPELDVDEWVRYLDDELEAAGRIEQKEV